MDARQDARTYTTKKDRAKECASKDGKQSVTWCVHTHTHTPTPRSFQLWNAQECAGRVFSSMMCCIDLISYLACMDCISSVVFPCFHGLDLETVSNSIMSIWICMRSDEHHHLDLFRVDFWVACSHQRSGCSRNEILSFHTNVSSRYPGSDHHAYQCYLGKSGQ